MQPYCESQNFLFSDFIKSLILVIRTRLNRRFLRARNFDLTAAFKQFSTTCQWRREKDLDSLYENFDVEALEDSKRLLPNWTGKTDKMGRGVFVYKIATLGGKETSELLKTKVEDRYDGV